MDREKSMETILNLQADIHGNRAVMKYMEIRMESFERYSNLTSYGMKLMNFEQEMERARDQKLAHEVLPKARKLLNDKNA
jgi:hypothetical protein